MIQRQRSTAPTLRFLGAAETVTGSRFLLSTPESSALVDCGLFQGLKELRLRNWDMFPVPAEAVNAVMLTHAHLDHSGYVPVLCREGFRGKVFATASTDALARILLPDSGHLQEEEALYANRKGYSKHKPARPLYTEQDALHSLEQFAPVPFESRIQIAPQLNASFRFAGHILGASSVLVEVSSPPHRVLFSGDLGRQHHPILRPPSPVPEADVIVVESTYGDSRHNDAESLERFENAIVRTAERKGTIIIPSFAVDRTEVLLNQIRDSATSGRIPSLPIYVDSPMALAALQIYRSAIARRCDEIREGIDASALDPGNLNEVRTVEESMALQLMEGPMIIISASGMATGGRVLHHLAHRLPNERNTVLLVGYQADGTRGRLLLNGEMAIKMLGRYIAVRAEIVNVPAFSVHADHTELIGWLRTAPRPPATCYVVHGEPTAAHALCDEIRKQLRWNAVVPRHLEVVRID
jgi:metallo-beta-lactamase family protein